MKKRILSLVLVGVMAFGLLTGCGGKEEAATEPAQEVATEEATEEVAENAAATELKEIRFAVPFAESGTIWMEQLHYNLENLLGPAANVKFDYQMMTFDADGVLSFVESKIAAGVDGLVFCPPSDSVLPTVAQLCEEAGVYWGIAMRQINDAEIKALCEASPYYIGNCYEDEENTGYLVGKYLGENDMTKIAIISTTKGDTTGDAREAGLARAAEEFGIEIVGEARGLQQASDVTSSVESFLSANADLDAVFVCGQTFPDVHGIAAKAVQDSGREEVKVVGIDHPDGIVDFFESGTYAYSVGTPTFALDTYVVMIKTINAIQGTPISGELEGKSSNSIAMEEVVDIEGAKAYSDAGSDREYKFFEADELDQLLKWNNPDLDESSLQEVLDNYEL